MTTDENGKYFGEWLYYGNDYYLDHSTEGSEGRYGDAERGQKIYITTGHTVNVNLTHLLDDRSTKHTNGGLKLAAEGNPKYKLSVWYQLIDMSYVKKRGDGEGVWLYLRKEVVHASTTLKKTRKDNESYQP